MQLPDEMTQRLAVLRQSFDESFAAPVRLRETGGHVLLAISAGGLRLAVRLGELAGIHLCRKIVPLPDSAGGLLGISGLRGRLLAVYDLAMLLGAESVQKGLRWVLLAGVDPHMALAVETLDAYVEVAPTDVYPAREGDAPHAYIHELVKHQGIARGVLSIPRIVDSARRRR